MQAGFLFAEAQQVKSVRLPQSALPTITRQFTAPKTHERMQNTCEYAASTDPDTREDSQQVKGLHTQRKFRTGIARETSPDPAKVASMVRGTHAKNPQPALHSRG